MPTSALKIWSADALSYVDFDCWSRLDLQMHLPGYEDSDEFDNPSLAVPSEELQALGHPTRATLSFFAGDLLIPSSATAPLDTLRAWLHEHITKKRETVTIVIRRAMDLGSAEEAGLEYFEVDAVDMPGWIYGKLSDPNDLGSAVREVAIPFIVGAWGTIDSYTSAPDQLAETPAHCVEIWRRPA